MGIEKEGLSCISHPLVLGEGFEPWTLLNEAASININTDSQK